MIHGKVNIWFNPPSPTSASLPLPLPLISCTCPLAGLKYECHLKLSPSDVVLASEEALTSASSTSQASPASSSPAPTASASSKSSWAASLEKTHLRVVWWNCCILADSQYELALTLVFAQSALDSLFHALGSCKCFNPFCFLIVVIAILGVEKCEVTKPCTILQMLTGIIWLDISVYI